MRSIKISDLTSFAFGESYISFCNLLCVLSFKLYRIACQNANKLTSSDDHTFHLTCNTTSNKCCFLPIVGKAHVAYISSGKVIGLSKLNRIVDYFSRRPQVQERLTRQIYNELTQLLNTQDVIVVMEASHLCVSSRGIKDTSSYTTTMET